MSIGQRFREVRRMADREGHKCTQAEFGEMFKIGRDAVANIENDRVVPPEILIENVCNKFGISYDWLSEGKGKKIPEDIQNISRLVAMALNGNNKLQKAVIQMICSRTKEELELLEKILNDLYESIK